MRRRASAIRWLLLALVVGMPTVAGYLWWSRARRTSDLVIRGMAAYERDDWSGAMELARQRLKEDRDDPEAMRLMARASIRLKRDDVGAAIYRRLGESTMTVEDLCVLGQSMMRAGQRASAMDVWEGARALDPSHGETLFELSRAYLSGDRLDDAARVVATLAAIPGWESRAEAILGAILMERNDPVAAAENWRRALGRPRPTIRAEGTPSPIVPLTELARALLRAGRPDEARAPLALVLEKGPDEEASWLMSRVDLQRRDWTAARADLARSGSFRADRPMQPEPSPFAGASKCTGCHPEEARPQQASRHARTFFRASELGKLALPEAPVPDPSGAPVVHTLRRDAEGRIRQQTRVDGRVLEAVVEYAFGSGDRGLTFVGRIADGRAYELRLSEYPETHGRSPAATRWDRTSGHPTTPSRPDDYLGQPLGADGVRRCLGCHVTDPKSIVDGQGACSADRAISCERCHGPGDHHLLAVEGKLAEIDPAIARPTLATGPRVVKLCAGCHSPRGQEVRRDDPGAVRFQGATLTWSRCYAESDGAMDCVTCHDPHRNASTSAEHYESRCLECHTRAESPAKPAGEGPPDHRRSFRRTLRESPRRTICPVNPSSGCVGCHMPEVKGVVPHSTFTDHYIRVHRD